MKRAVLREKIKGASFVLLLLFIVAACSNSNDSASPAPDRTPNPTSDPKEASAPPANSQEQNTVIDIGEAALEPAELLIYSIVPSVTEEEFERTMNKPILSKYPHYKVKYMLSGEESLDNLMIMGNDPDIIMTSIGGLYAQMVPRELEYDLSDLIDKYNYDLDRIEPALIESVQNAAPNKEIYGLPKYTNGVVMFYNIDLFDHFGVDYPVNGMTWDEAYQLATIMTRAEDGMQYRGMSFFYNNMFAENQLSQPYFSTSENKAAVNTPGFQKFVNEYLRFYQIEGNMPEGNFSADTELNNFYREKNIAMNLAPLSGFGRFSNDLSFNWDIVAAPTFSDLPGIGYQPNPIYYFISNVNGKAEQAFQVAAEWLSDEVQLMSNKEGRATSLRDEAIRATLGQDHPDFYDKNFAALFYNEFAPVPPTNPEAASLVNAQNIVLRWFKEAVTGNVDVNTMLRSAEEEINQAIAEALAGK